MATSIERHPFPASGSTEEFLQMMERMDRQKLAELPDHPERLGSTFFSLLASAKSRCVQNPDAGKLETWEAVVAAMQTGAALFAAAVTPPGETVECRIAHEVYRIPGTGPVRDADAGNWLDAFWLAIVCREQERMTQLCQVPIELLRDSGAVYDEYIYHWIDALQAYWLERPGLSDKLIGAYEGALPENLQVAPGELVLKIMSGPIDLLYRFLTRDSEALNASLVQALQLHRAYWTADEERLEQSLAGAIALGPLAMACLGYDAERPITVESDYLPEHLLKRSWVGEFPT